MWGAGVLVLLLMAVHEHVDGGCEGLEQKITFHLKYTLLPVYK